MKIGAGYFSNILGVRKAIVFIGYAFSAGSRFLLGFAGNGIATMGLRLTDGVGKGLKDDLRDALVEGSAGSRKLGLAFGIQQTLDTLGSALGPLITYGLYYLTGERQYIAWQWEVKLEAYFKFFRQLLNISRNKQTQVIAIVLDRNPLINTRAGLIIRTIRVFAMVELTLCVRVMAPEVFIP